MREKLMQLIEEADDTCNNTKCSDCEYNGQDCWTRLIAETLIANDVVPVVRCKDCKYWTMGYCNHFAYYDYEPMTSEDDFCSYGVRADEYP